MIRNFEDFCRELENCGFSMGGGNAKGIFALIDHDWTNQDALDTPVKWHCGDRMADAGTGGADGHCLFQGFFQDQRIHHESVVSLLLCRSQKW